MTRRCPTCGADVVVTYAPPADAEPRGPGVVACAAACGWEAYVWPDAVAERVPLLPRAEGDGLQMPLFGAPK